MKRYDLKQIKKLKIPFPLHPILFAIFPILFFFSHNKGQLLLLNSNLINSLLLAVSLALVLLLIFSFIFRSVEKSGLFTSIFLVFFFSYGHVNNLLGNLHYEIGIFSVGSDKTLFSAALVILVLSSYFLFKFKNSLYGLSAVLNIIAAFLVIFSLVDIVSYELSTRRAIADQEGKNINEGEMVLKRPKQPPDIYYVIFDGFPSSSTLKDIYNYDDSEIMNYLKKRGFYIADKSLSNYAHTHFSLPSSLNMEYINYLADSLGENSRDTSVPKAMIEENKVVLNLKSLGYKFIQIGSEYEPTLRSKYADINVNDDENQSSVKIAGLSYRLNEYSTTFLQTTALSPFIKNFIDDNVRAQRLNALNNVSEVANLRGPKFIFAHLVISHPPPLFDSEGKPLSKSQLEQIGEVYTDQENNLNQIIFVSKKMKEMANNILSRSDSPPIIIFQSDHGPTSLLGHPNYWKRPFDKNIRGVKERMRILNLYYLPDGGNKLLYDSISPVNSFRIIFNFYFGANYKLLPDKSYYSDFINFYEFFDVTKRLK